MIFERVGARASTSLTEASQSERIEHHLAPRNTTGKVFVTEGAKIVYLTVDPDDDLYRLINTDPTAAAQSLISFTNISGRSIEDKVSLTRKFCAVVKYALERKENLTVLITHDFFGSVLEVAFDENNYNLKRATKHRNADDGKLYVYYWIDQVSTSLLYMTMRLLTLSLAGLEVLMQKELGAVGRLPVWCDRAALEESAKTYRRIIWDQRGRMLEPRDVEDEIDSRYCARPALLSCVVADCLFAWHQIVKYAREQPGVCPHKPEDIDQNGMNDHLLHWIYSTMIKDDGRAEPMFQALNHDLHVVSDDPTMFQDWFNRATTDIARVFPGETSMKLDIVICLRRTLHSTVTSIEHYLAVLLFLGQLADNHGMHQTLEKTWRPHHNPVYWTTKSMQRRIGQLHGEQGAKVLSIAVQTALRWSEVYQVPWVQALHTEMRIPLMPFLSRLVCVRPETTTVEKYCTHTARLLVDSSETWIRAERLKAARTASTAPYMDDTARRIWIKTLTELRARPSSTTKKDLIDTWLRFGLAYGFAEHAERRWISQGDHRETVPASPLPWGHCAWRECICYEQRPLFPMAACKGCWEVYYCSESCQRHDWNDGHREHCNRLDRR